MHVDDGFAALKFFEDRLQGRVSEVHAVGIRKENKAIEPEDIACVESSPGRHRHPARGGRRNLQTDPVVNEPFGREFVAAARQSPRFGAISRVHAGVLSETTATSMPASSMNEMLASLDH